MPTLNPDASTGINNINFLQPTAFKLSIDRKNYPNLEFFAQTVMHPSMTLGFAEMPYSRIGTIAMAGDKLTFGELSATIILDENMNSYTEMYNWMKRIVENTNVSALDRNLNNIPTEADITVSILSSHNNVLKRIRYIDCIPTLLGDVSFESTTGDIQYLTFPISFKFSYFDIA
jgi:hypothetical protein